MSFGTPLGIVLATPLATPRRLAGKCLLRALLCAIACCAVPPARAQAPESGRWQDFSFAADDVARQVEDRYIEQVVGLAAAGQLDNDHVLLARLRRIGAGLVRAAVAIRPEAAQWQWELHCTSDPEVEAISMAGGKILVGSAFVHRLALSDGELATLLGHEIAHALAEHHRETLSVALHLNHKPLPPLDVLMERLDTDLSLQIRLAQLSSMQESEADQLGMVLAHSAGWAGADMVGFYRKLAAAGGNGDGALVASGYPTAASRVSMAMGMARLFAGRP